MELLAPIMYLVAGANSQEVLEGTATTMALSPLMGYLGGYSVDLARDLTGIKESSRIYKKITQLSKGAKKGLAALLVAGLVAINYGIYETTSEEHKISSQPLIEIKFTK